MHFVQLRIMSTTCVVTTLSILHFLWGRATEHQHVDTPACGHVYTRAHVCTHKCTHTNTHIRSHLHVPIHTHPHRNIHTTSLSLLFSHAIWLLLLSVIINYSSAECLWNTTLVSNKRQEDSYDSFEEETVAECLVSCTGEYPLCKAIDFKDKTCSLFDFHDPEKLVADPGSEHYYTIGCDE